MKNIASFFLLAQETIHIMKGECITMFKRFFEYALMGAGTCVGYFAMRKGIDIASDPVKKAEFKRKITNAKNAFTEKTES